MPHGRTTTAARATRRVGRGAGPRCRTRWSELERALRAIVDKHPKLAQAQPVHQLGTLGTGNHFIEVCLDEDDASGSCCTPARAASATGSAQYFIELAKEDMRSALHQPAGRDLAYLSEGTQHFDDYVEARDLGAGLRAEQPPGDDGGGARVRCAMQLAAVRDRCEVAVNCHHNYVRARAPLRRGRARHAQGRGARGRGRARHHPGLDGRALVHRARQGQPGVVRELQPRRGPRDVAHRGEAAASRSRTTRARPRASSAARTRT